MDKDIFFNCCPHGLAPDWSQYSQLEIGGCIDDADEDTDGTYIVGCQDRWKAEFFSVYGRKHDGQAEIITDVDTFDNAEAVARKLGEVSGLKVEVCC